MNLFVNCVGTLTHYMKSLEIIKNYSNSPTVIETNGDYMQSNPDKGPTSKIW